MLQSRPAILMLADGTTLYGQAIGATGTTAGEICFNTGMTGYQEIFTDPSYLGQIIVATHTHIGNYGVKDAEAESDGIKIAGLICKNFSEIHSPQADASSLQDYFASQGLVGIAGVDTRALVRHIRAQGAMNAIISSAILDEEMLRQQLAAHPSMEGLELSSRVSTKAPFFYNEGGHKRVAVIDFGTKNNILRSLASRGCHLQVFPAYTPAEEVLATTPDGIMLTNGPGDPAAMPEAVAQVKKYIAAEVPTFGICMGHQILAQAAGAKTFKMRFGHRGLNHPVKNLLTNKSEITSQNHGFAVEKASVEASGQLEITHLHLNDDTVAGVRVKDKPAFSVQYHPESTPGPNDSRYLFDQFVGML